MFLSEPLSFRPRCRAQCRRLLRNQLDCVRLEEKPLNPGRAEGTRANGPCLGGAPATAPHPQSGTDGVAVCDPWPLDPWRTVQRPDPRLWGQEPRFSLLSLWQGGQELRVISGPR